MRTVNVTHLSVLSRNVQHAGTALNVGSVGLQEMDVSDPRIVRPYSRTGVTRYTLHTPQTPLI